MVYLTNKQEVNNSSVAILLALFNRPQYFLQMAESINAINPKKIYIHIDGPRNSEDSKKIKEIINLLDKIDKSIDKEVLIQDKNLGCGLGMVTAISWFFEKEKYGIILEDDCIPNPTFYDYCNQLLPEYKNNENIFMISGDNGGQIIPEKHFGDNDLISIPTPLIWGWATWKNRWEEYEYNELNLNFINIFQNLKEFEIFERFILIKYFYKLKNYKVLNTWDIHLFYKLIVTGKRCIVPRMNLIKNIGFGDEATHTKESTFRSNAKTYKVDIKNKNYTNSNKITNSKIIYLLHSNLDKAIVHNRPILFTRVVYMRGRLVYLVKSVGSKVKKELKQLFS